MADNQLTREPGNQQRLGQDRHLNDSNDPQIGQQSQERKDICVGVIQKSPNMDFFSVTGVYALIRYLKSTDRSLNVTGRQDYGQTDEDDWHYHAQLGLESPLVQRIS
ncbi:hypothetical protein GX48_06025 [Paracoccidioides brasiliensis]|nr:hypothetical protein GX48_06025 [Paracoccidioides brasiliensis]